MRTNPVAEATITVAEALATIRSQIARTVAAGATPLAAARNRFLATDLVAAVDLPPHDGAAVDGFALRFADLSATGPTRLDVVGLAAAGRPFVGTVAERQAVRIFTGATLPPGADVVVMQEYCRAADGSVTIPPGPRPAEHCRRRGEDVRAGSVVLPAGHRLRPPDIALAAALGFAGLPVFDRLRVALFSTGDELREAGVGLAAGQVCDANRWLLRGLLEGLGCSVSDRGILPDRRPAIEQALSDAAHDHDLLVTSGGMSVGAEDHVGAVIRRRGTLDIWRLAVKPGKPVGVGDIDACPVLALPGNPIAAAVTFIALGRAIVLRLAGGLDEPPLSLRLPIGSAWTTRAGRREYLFATVTNEGGGASVVVPSRRQGAAMLSAVTAAQGFIILDEETLSVEAGDLVEFLPLAPLLG